MSRYAEALREEDPRIARMFDVERETHDSGSFLIEDPFPALKKLLEKGPVQEGQLGELLDYPASAKFNFHTPGQRTFTALSFAAVSRALMDNETFSSDVYFDFPSSKLFPTGLVHLTGAHHRRIRTPIQPFFSPDAAQAWWGPKIIDETVEVLMSKIEGKGSADLFLELCARMPMHVVSAGFGIEPDEIVPFRVAMMGGAGLEERPADPLWGLREARRILNGVIERRRKNPENDLITKLVEAEVAEPDGSKRPFTNDEIIDNCQLILLAGGGTTWRQLGITLYALLNNPDQFEELKADRSLLPNVVLESARWHPTDLIFPRRVTKDTVLDGVEIPAGVDLHMCLGAANRDPKRWENADKFDIFRGVQRGVAFGGGPHSCLGQHVSRQEMVVAMNAIMDRLPNVRWDKSKPEPRLAGGLFARGPTAIPVVWDVA